mmetsp:Transcript_5523/g.13999  ORF Transcript_5523/g.13999 Transcript_5523/m.13999 type:complete len:316 (+) Transcript_5523:204-1151(+)|eukprot:CAMPEP_0197576766 /NCGR_PEP_ID=MMETSP1326-20131121/1657_1 /TAXON_ID=1155430 /ORGANISM="Genus nov. species nov., Strain RCC2288" /LENGTH=315 /DNA_ID=CAMNT_0043139733 /DNA_START=204 /DNA_END=1151 /DNA_ORIENTATION=+
MDLLSSVEQMNVVECVFEHLIREGTCRERISLGLTCKSAAQTHLRDQRHIARRAAASSSRWLKVTHGAGGNGEHKRALLGALGTLGSTKKRLQLNAFEEAAAFGDLECVGALMPSAAPDSRYRALILAVDAGNNSAVVNAILSFDSELMRVPKIITHATEIAAERGHAELLKTIILSHILKEYNEEEDTQGGLLSSPLEPLEYKLNCYRYWGWRHTHWHFKYVVDTEGTLNLSHAYCDDSKVFTNKRELWALLHPQLLCVAAKNARDTTVGMLLGLQGGCLAAEKAALQLQMFGQDDAAVLLKSIVATKKVPTSA